MVAWLSSHDVVFGSLVGKGYGWNNVGAKVHEEEGDGASSQRDGANHVEDVWSQLRKNVCESVTDRLL